MVVQGWEAGSSSMGARAGKGRGNYGKGNGDYIPYYDPGRGKGKGWTRWDGSAWGPAKGQKGLYRAGYQGKGGKGDLYNVHSDPSAAKGKGKGGTGGQGQTPRRTRTRAAAANNYHEQKEDAKGAEGRDGKKRPTKGRSRRSTRPRTSTSARIATRPILMGRDRGCKR